MVDLYRIDDMNTALFLCDNGVKSKSYTVKPEIFACPLFREFRDLDKFAKITGHKYSNGNCLLSTSLIQPNTKLLVTGNAH